MHVLDKKRRDQMIRNGIKRLEEADTPNNYRESMIEGFNLCKVINSLEEYDDIIRKRRLKEEDLIKNQSRYFWDHRWTSIPIETVYKMLTTKVERYD